MLIATRTAHRQTAGGGFVGAMAGCIGAVSLSQGHSNCPTDGFRHDDHDGTMSDDEPYLKTFVTFVFVVAFVLKP
jgi:hypothetical protein